MLGVKTHRAFFTLANEVSAALNYSIFLYINMALPGKTNYDQPLQNQAGRMQSVTTASLGTCNSELNTVPQTY